MWLVVVLIWVLLRAIAVGEIRDTQAKTALLKVAQVLVVTSLRRALGKSRQAHVLCGKGCFGFWICVMNSTTLSELDPIEADEKRLRTNYSEVKSV
jgi:hypothetical protein